MGWHLLETLLQQVGEHSTLIGKLWVTATFVFRFVVVASVGDAVYSDEQSDFTCNTGQPGCENVCFNRFSPISHLRFWAAQIIIVSTPSIVFIVFTLHILMRMPQPEDSGEEADEVINDDLGIHPVPTGTDIVVSEQPGSAPSPGRRKKRGKRGKGGGGGYATRSKHRVEVERPVGVHHGGGVHGHDVFDEDEGEETDEDDLHDENEHNSAISAIEKSNQRKELMIKRSVQAAYALSLLLRTAAEVVFLWLQINLYGFNVVEIYKCERIPCPNIVDCFVSRPREKSIFLWFMFATSLLCIALNVAEINYLGLKRLIRLVLNRRSNNNKNIVPPPLPPPAIITNGDLKIDDNWDDNEKKPIPSAPPPDFKNLYKITDYKPSWNLPKEDNKDVIAFDLIGDKPNRNLPGYPNVHRYAHLHDGFHSARSSEDEVDEDSQ